MVAPGLPKNGQGPHRAKCMSLEDVSGRSHLLGGRGTFDIEGVVGLLLFPGFSTLWGQDSRSANMWSIRDRVGCRNWHSFYKTMPGSQKAQDGRVQLHPLLWPHVWSHAGHAGGSISPCSFPVWATSMLQFLGNREPGFTSTFSMGL